MSKTKFDHLSQDILAKALMPELARQEIKEYVMELGEILIGRRRLRNIKIHLI